MNSSTDPAAIDLEAIKTELYRGYFNYLHTHNLIATVEALRERVAGLEAQIVTAANQLQLGARI